MTIRPDGENIRKAIKWFSAERQDNPDTPIHKLVDQACIHFNLSPKEAEYLDRLARGKISDV